MKAKKRRRTQKKARTPRGARAARVAPAGIVMSGDVFRHVVVLMLENRSFDHMLGALQAERPEIDGIPPDGPPRVNIGPHGRAYPQAPGASRSVDPDPMHETPNVLNQLDDDNGRFVKDYARSYPATTAAARQEVMAYHAPGTLPALHALARSFAVCDRWFSAVPGPTWTNRLFAMSGTSQGRVEMPAGLFRPNLHRYDQPSVFRRVEQAGRRCRIYAGDFPLSLLLADRRTVAGARSIAWFDDFLADCGGDAGEFPDLAFIEPDYLGGDADDDHPPHDVQRAQQLLARVYDAIRANRGLWESTLLVVTYDEHGGFYDHVAPPAAIPPDGHREEYTFDRYGVRVPAVLVSPWIEPQVVKTEVDHTALLRSIQLRWKLGPMGARVSGAADLFAAVGLTDAPRTDTPVRLAAAPKARALAVPKARAAAAARLTRSEEAIVAFSQWLDAQTPAPARTKVAAQTRALRAPTDSRAVAEERARRFLRARGGRG